MFPLLSRHLNIAPLGGTTSTLLDGGKLVLLLHEDVLGEPLAQFVTAREDASWKRPSPVARMALCVQAATILQSFWEVWFKGSFNPGMMVVCGTDDDVRLVLRGFMGTSAAYLELMSGDGFCGGVDAYRDPSPNPRAYSACTFSMGVLMYQILTGISPTNRRICAGKTSLRSAIRAETAAGVCLSAGMCDITRCGFGKVFCICVYVALMPC